MLDARHPASLANFDPVVKCVIELLVVALPVGGLVEIVREPPVRPPIVWRQHPHDQGLKPGVPQRAQEPIFPVVVHVSRILIFHGCLTPACIALLPLPCEPYNPRDQHDQHGEESLYPQEQDVCDLLYRFVCSLGFPLLARQVGHVTTPRAAVVTAGCAAATVRGRAHP